jgi:hypothetical protein
MVKLLVIPLNQIHTKNTKIKDYNIVNPEEIKLVFAETFPLLLNL